MAAFIPEETEKELLPSLSRSGKHSLALVSALLQLPQAGPAGEAIDSMTWRVMSCWLAGEVGVRSDSRHGLSAASTLVTAERCWIAAARYCVRTLSC